KKQQADAIHVLDSRERKNSSQLGSDVAFTPVDGAERHRRRNVDRDDHREIALLDELLHVRSARARSDVPIDCADVVARLIFADLRELDPAPMKGGVIVARKTGADEPRRKNLEVANASGDRNLKLRLLA